MASQDIIQCISETASEETKKQLRQLWIHFNQTLRVGRPVMFMPKFYGDQLGETVLEAIATRMSILIATTVYIQYHPVYDAYLIAPAANLPGGLNRFRICYIISPRDSVSEVFARPDPTLLFPSLDEVLAASIESPVENEKVLKSPNSFILFRSHAYVRYHRENPGGPKMEAEDFSRMASYWWKKATPEQKEHFAELARELKEKGRKSSGESSSHPLGGDPAVA